MGFNGAFHPKSRARACFLFHFFDLFCDLMTILLGTMGGDSARSVDGCATFWNKELFTMARTDVVEYQTLGLRSLSLAPIASPRLSRLLTFVI